MFSSLIGKHNKQRQSNYKTRKEIYFIQYGKRQQEKGSRLFDVTVGAFDGAEAYKLVGTFLLYKLLYQTLWIWEHFFGPASARSYKIDVVGNNLLASWLVGNAVFSETALRIFLIFWMKLGDYKGRKVTELEFWKNSSFGDIREKVSKLAQNQTLWYFSQKRFERFFWFLAWS